MFISGKTPRARDVIGAPFEEQARAALDNLEAIARASGLSLQHAVKVGVFLRNIRDRVAFDAIYAGDIGEPLPAGALLNLVSPNSM